MPKEKIIPKTEEISKLEVKTTKQTTEQKQKIREEKYQFTTNWFEPHVPRWEKTLLPFKEQKNQLENKKLKFFLSNKIKKT